MTGGRLASVNDLEAIVADFSWTLRSELDYVREGRNADRLREILADYPTLVVPTVIWELTTEKVLVMERIEGARLAASVDVPADVDRSALARAGAEGMLKQVFEAGFFHADPIPEISSSWLTADWPVLDFGMVGYLDDDLKLRWLQLLDAAVRQDAADATDALESLGVRSCPRP